MVAELKGPIFGPYHCSNCLMRQPKELKSNCIFCGNWFSNYEERLIEEDAESFILHTKERELYESNNDGRD